MSFWTDGCPTIGSHDSSEQTVRERGEANRPNRFWLRSEWMDRQAEIYESLAAHIVAQVPGRGPTVSFLASSHTRYHAVDEPGWRDSTVCTFVG